MREDIKILIKKNKIITFGYKQSYAGLEKLLEDNEKVFCVYNGNVRVNNNNELKIDVLKIKDKKPTVFVITNNRLIFYYKVLLNENYMQIPIEEMRGYDFKRDGITGGVLRIQSLTKSFDLDIVYRKETMQCITEALEEAKKGKTNINQENNNDDISKIRDLSQLKDEGIISEEEFQHKKLELLNKI